jgi:hypothetical protein
MRDLANNFYLVADQKVRKQNNAAVIIKSSLPSSKISQIVPTGKYAAKPLQLAHTQK